MVFEWSCRYPDCKEKIRDRPISTKYCNLHATIRKKEVAQINNRKSYLKRRINKTKMLCIVCNDVLPQTKSKYCSDPCKVEGLREKRKHRNYINNEIKRHEKAIALLKEQKKLKFI